VPEAAGPILPKVGGVTVKAKSCITVVLTATLAEVAFATLNKATLTSPTANKNLMFL
jgi:hypothetical protein